MWDRIGRRWGRHGAAGVLFVCGDEFLLAQRSIFVFQSGSWGLPGRALRAGESALDGALREAREELGRLPDSFDLRHTHVFTAGDWSYTSHVLRIGTRFQPARLNWETTATAWFTDDQARDLRLHPGLRRAW